MMTCANVCKAWNVPEFNVNYMYCEYLKERSEWEEADEQPLARLICKQAKNVEEKAVFKDTFLGGVNWVDEGKHEDLVTPRFPESREDI